MKRCPRCGQEKPLSEFHNNRTSKDGHVDYCKPCVRAYSKDWLHRNQDRHTAMVLAWRRKNPDRYREQDRRAKAKHRLVHRDRQWARQSVHKAIKNGILTPQPCEVCGTTDRIEAHHDDYSKPLEVRCLCNHDHKEWHKANRVVKQVAA